MPSDRYKIVETRGFAIHNPPRATTGQMHEQMTVAVLDSAYCYRECGIWRTETRNVPGYRGAAPSAARFAHARAQAVARVAELTALNDPDECARCGAGREQLAYDVVDGWCCRACGGCDSDE